MQALRGKSGSVVGPAAVLFRVSWRQLVEPCDQFGHVGPGCLIPHRGPLLKACPSMLYPRASRVSSLDKPLRNLHCFLISSPFPLTEEFLNDSTCGPTRTDVRAVVDEPRLNTGIRQCHCAEIPTDPSQPVLQIMNMGALSSTSQTIQAPAAPSRPTSSAFRLILTMRFFSDDLSRLRQKSKAKAPR